MKCTMSPFDSRRLLCRKYAIGNAVMASDGSEHHFARRDVALSEEVEKTVVLEGPARYNGR